MDEHRVSELIARKGQRYESLAAAGEMLFPGAADFIRTAVAAAVPIAIASGALTHEIEDVLERAGLLGSVPGDRRRRSNRTQQAASGSVSDRVRSAARADRPRSDSPGERWRSRIRAGGWSPRGAADLRCVAVTNTYSEAELRADAELVVPGLHALTLDALDALCAD